MTRAIVGSGLCACGCGGRVATTNQKGERRRRVVRTFIQGHNRLGVAPDWIPFAIKKLQQTDPARVIHVARGLIRKSFAKREPGDMREFYIELIDAMTGKLAKSKSAPPRAGGE